MSGTATGLMAASFSEDFMGSSAEAAGRLPDELELPVITLRDSVLYPRAVTPLYVNRDRAMRAIAAASALGFALVIAQKTDRTEEPKPSELFSVGTIAMLGRNGLDINDPTDKYTLKALPGSFSGLHLLAIMYTAFRQIDPTMETGADFGAEYQAALEMQKT